MGAARQGALRELVCSAMSKYGKPLATPSDTTLPWRHTLERFALAGSCYSVLLRTYCDSTVYQALGGAAPDRIAEINGNEALVSRCRLLARAPHP